jgi:membrane-associated protease RseP (regulator of RpoE activity)
MKDPPQEVALGSVVEPPDNNERLGQTLADVTTTDLSDPDVVDNFPWPRFRLPLILFLLTCVSTLYCGIRHWIPWKGFDEGIDGYVLQPSHYDRMFFLGVQIRRELLTNLDDGLIYMLALLGILLAHEFGHFIATRIYRVPATWPLFVPMPFSPIGTMGAVILMDNRKADRRMMFDIGLAGPLAGLVVAIPVMLLGMMQVRLDIPARGAQLDMPIAVRAVLPLVHSGYHGEHIALNQISPLFMAGWVGLLITGLNMMPVGQLDGGHVTYALFGSKARIIARVFMAAAFAIMGVSFSLYVSGVGDYGQYYVWLPMALLVMLIGIDHPPTADDSVPLGWGRTVLGFASLAIPFLTFAPELFVQ